MSYYSKLTRPRINTILFFVLVVFIAFLPISSFLFFLKNDAFNNYFPPKFFISESIHAGYLPLWNPYINFGIPQYGDMNSGYWSPLTWLIASTVGYNAYTFTIETLFYILLGGVGMYKLSGLWKLNTNVRLIAGVAFMCCGYNVGHLQHFNWLSGAAILPWCLWSYLLLWKNISTRNVLLTSLLFYLLIASAHPGIIIGVCYFFTGLMIFVFLKNENKRSLSARARNFGISHGGLLLLLLLFSAGLISAYSDIIPQFVRGEKISLSESLGNPANLQSWISCLLPFATVKNDAFYATDPSMRNSYFGITLLLFFILALVKKKTSWQKFFLFTGLAFALLSSGGIFKSIAYQFLPFTGYVRLSGEFRIFSLLCFILVAAIELNEFIIHKKKFEGGIKRVYFLLEIILFAAIVFGLYFALTNKESLLYTSGYVLQQSTFTLKLKALVKAISFYDTLWIQGILQLFFLWGIRWCLRSANWRLLKTVTVINMVTCCLLNIPYTGVGKASVAQVQHVLNRSPKGIPTPVLQPIIANDTLGNDEKGLVGDWSLYNKQIGVTKEVPYPIILKNMRGYFENRDTTNDCMNKAFLFTGTGGNDIVITSFSPGKIRVATTADSSSRLVLQQNFYPHWFYQNGAEKKEVDKAGINFMSAPIYKGSNEIIFSFEPTFIKWMMVLSGVSILLAILVFILTSYRFSFHSS